METRRDALRLAVAGTLAVPALARSATTSPEFAASQEAACGQLVPTWGRGIEGQRKADLGNGRYLNPILSGDYPDPTVLKDGDDYYMTH